MNDWIGILLAVLLIGNAVVLSPWLCLTSRLRQHDDPRRSIVIPNLWVVPMVAVIVGVFWWDGFLGFYACGILAPHIWFILSSDRKLEHER